MSKKSLFCFNTTNLNDKENLINNIMTGFLKRNKFTYREDLLCYCNGTSCLEYSLLAEMLIIKAYTLHGVYGVKWAVHSAFNNDAYGRNYYSVLKNELFTELEKNGIPLINVKSETSKDGTTSTMVKIILWISLVTVIVCGTFALLSYLRTH